MSRTGRPALRGGVVLAALAAGVAAFAPGAAPGPAAGPCPTRGVGPAIGSVLQLVNSSAYVGGKYVGAAPFGIRAGDSICTDTRGQLVFALTGSRGTTACITLRSSRVLAIARLRFERGTSWCVARGAALQLTVGPTNVTADKDSLFGISVRDGKMLVKVLAGSMNTPYGRIERSRQATLGPGASTTNAVPTADDRRAIAQLSAALAKLS